MTKLWSRLCFLVLAISSITRGQTVTSDSPSNKETEGSPTPTPHPSSEEVNEIGLPTSPPFQSPVSKNATDHNSTDITTPEETRKSQEGDSLFNTTTKGSDRTEAPVETTTANTTGSMSKGAGVGSAAVSTATTGISTKPAEDTGSSSWGYVILGLIIVVIVVLCVILYFLRRVSRTYSFDLQRPDPIINQFTEPTGTFEQVYLDDLDRPTPKDQVTTDDLSPPPVSNGTSLQSEEKDTSGENDPQEQPDANGLETLPTSNTSHLSGDDPDDKTSSPPSSTNLFFDASGEAPQNENNNNPSVFSTDPFVEINLDEPAWCDQLLTSPEATSSVLPFSPFSFSSSSSS
ncbi:uncharacterized protein [Trachinotus anak]|uniref:uncharacterized protein n=1 Tax=Trachinotus anak TaxID=443729 RepID=UPI0039F1C400